MGEMALAELRAHPQNYNRHSEGQIGRLAESLQRFGQPKEIVVWNGMIIAGHGLVEGARRLGWTALRARDMSMDWTEAEALAFMAADNELARLGDPDEAALAQLVAGLGDVDAQLAALAAGSEERLAELLASLAEPPGEDPGPQVDRAEELRVKWGVETGQLWQLGEHRLVCGDCTDSQVVARVMGGDVLDGLITDPPYSSGGFTRGDRQAKTSAKYQFNQDDIAVRYVDFAGDNKDQRSWITWCHLWLSLWLQRAREGTVLGLFIDWRQLPALTDAVQSAGWLWRGVAVWDKTEAARPLYGRFKPQCEFVVWGSAGPLPINDGSPAYAGVCRQAVASSEKQHLTQKPVEVGEWSLSMTKAGSIVVDPFSGSGTTLIACERLGRRCRAVEISPAYCAVAIERWAVMTGGTPVLVEAAAVAHDAPGDEQDGDDGEEYE